MTRIRNRAELVMGADGAQAKARRALALDLFDAALASVDPVLCTQRALRTLRDEGKVRGPVTLLSFGKAARGMAEAALAEIDVARGIVIGFEAGSLGPLQLLRGRHPIPADDAPAHGQAVLDLARELSAGDTMLVLVSGGGSALLEVPLPGLTMTDLQETTRTLLASGASIQEVNEVRSALSAVKGGKLARVMAPARVINVVLSDVIGSPLHAIASGPTVAPNTQVNLAQIVDRYRLASRVKPNVWSALQRNKPVEGDFSHVRSVIAADNLTAQQAMVAEAARLGHVARRRQHYVEGEAKLFGLTLCREARAQPTVYVAGGETTVTLGQQVGCGGRNQEVVLAAAEEFHDGLIASIGTDGIDGASEAAGALLDASLLARIRSLGADPRHFLAGHDSGALLAAAGGTVVTGTTGTNVADLCLVIPQ